MEIVSTMGSGTLGRELDLEAVIKEIESVVGPVDANFTSDSVVTFRLEEDGPAYTVYRTGTFQIRGSTSKKELYAAEEVFLDVLDRISVNVLKYEFEHVASVFMSDLERDVNLSALAVSLGLDSIEYEPEQFPGLIYWPERFECALLVFGSGKIIITGGQSKKEAENAFEFLNNHLDEIHSL